MTMSTPPTVSADEWEAARNDLLAKEKELTRARDALNRADQEDDGDAQAARDRALARLRAAGEQV